MTNFKAGDKILITKFEKNDGFNHVNKQMKKNNINGIEAQISPNCSIKKYNKNRGFAFNCILLKNYPNITNLAGKPFNKGEKYGFYNALIKKI